MTMTGDDMHREPITGWVPINEGISTGPIDDAWDHIEMVLNETRTHHRLEGVRLGEQPAARTGGTVAP